MSTTLTEGAMIYFVQAEAGPIKIGFTDKWPHRLRALQHGTYEALTPLLVVAGCMADEAAVHSRFNSLRIRGEWFRRDDALLAYIDSRRAEALTFPPKRKQYVYRAETDRGIHRTARFLDEGKRLLAEAFATGSLEDVAERLGVSVRHAKHLANKVSGSRHSPLTPGSAARAVRTYGASTGN